LLGSDQQDFYQGMFDDQLSMELTKGRGLGLADMLVQQLTRAGLAPAPATHATGVAATKTGATSTASASDIAASFVSSIDFRTGAARGSLWTDQGPSLFNTDGTGRLEGAALDSTRALIEKML